MNQPTDRQAVVSQAIKYLLSAGGATRKQLAEFIGQHPSTISDRLNGKTSITVNDLDEFAAFFDVAIDVLWKTEDELDQWFGEEPSRRRTLRQRIAVIDLTDDETSPPTSGFGATGWTHPLGRTDYVIDLREGVQQVNESPQRELAVAR
jgi:transcriptional regulator with XRE-family HTH domain